MFKAAKDLKKYPEIIVKGADKSSLFFIMNRNEYKAKLYQISSDSTKFNILTKNSIKELKTRINKLIKIADSNNEPRIFQPIVDEFKTRYIYGTVKTDKAGFPLRPIISQLPTPIYNTAKIFNKLIIPYLPAKYQINSTEQLLDIIRACCNSFS